MNQNNDIYVMGSSSPSPGGTPGKKKALLLVVLAIAAVGVLLYLVFSPGNTVPVPPPQDEEESSLSHHVPGNENKDKRDVEGRNLDLQAMKQNTAASPEKGETTGNLGVHEKEETQGKNDAGSGSKDHAVTATAAKPEDAKVPAALLETVYFNFDSAELRHAGIRKLTDLRENMINRQGTLMVEGHTCSIGPVSYNQKLSIKRAEVVSEKLKALGLNDMLKIVIKGWGDSKPVENNSIKEGRAKNRRVEIILKEK